MAVAHHSLVVGLLDVFEIAIRDCVQEQVGAGGNGSKRNEAGGGGGEGSSAPLQHRLPPQRVQQAKQMWRTLTPKLSTTKCTSL